MTDENQESIISLDDVFKDDSEETLNESEEVTVEKEEPKPEESKEEEGEEESTEVDDEPKSVPIAALQAERAKRQELDKRIQELEERLQTAEPEEDLPDPIDDPEGYKKALREQWEKEQTEKSQKAQNESIEKSRSKALETHTDYPDMEKLFLFLSQGNQELVSKMRNSDDPAEFAYQYAKTHKEAEREKLKAEIMAELKPAETDKSVKATEVPDLTKATGSGSNSNPAPKAETLDEIFKDQKY